MSSIVVVTVTVLVEERTPLPPNCPWVAVESVGTLGPLFERCATEINSRLSGLTILSRTIRLTCPEQEM